MPFMRSESCSFIWHPHVVTWELFCSIGGPRLILGPNLPRAERSSGGGPAGGSRRERPYRVRIPLAVREEGPRERGPSSFESRGIRYGDCAPAGQIPKSSQVS